MTQRVVITLSTEELAELTACEKTIKSGLRTFMDVGRALMNIRDKRLYRARYKTFEEYCQTKWEFGRRQANFLISSAKVAENLGTEVPKPKHPSQLRPLSPLTPEEQRTAYGDAVEEAGGITPTAAQVQAAVDRLNPVDFEPKPEPPAPTPVPEPQPSTDGVIAELVPGELLPYRNNLDWSKYIDPQMKYPQDTKARIIHIRPFPFGSGGYDAARRAFPDCAISYGAKLLEMQSKSHMEGYRLQLYVEVKREQSSAIPVVATEPEIDQHDAWMNEEDAIMAAPAPDPASWRSVLQPTKWYPVDDASKHIYNRPFDDYKQARAIYHMGGVPELGVRMGSDILSADLRNAERYKDYILWEDSTTAADNPWIKAFATDKWYLVDLLNRTIDPTPFESKEHGELGRKERAYTATKGAWVLAGQDKEYVGFALVEGALAIVNTPPLRFHRGVDRAYCPKCGKYHGAWIGLVDGDCWICEVPQCHHKVRDAEMELDDPREKPLQARPSNGNGNGHKPAERVREVHLKIWTTGGKYAYEDGNLVGIAENGMLNGLLNNGITLDELIRARDSLNSYIVEMQQTQQPQVTAPAS